ncbi:MAG: inositol monophosphatase [Ramlibacter sp.]|nr:inositol monophosphatase [Ramlibacter sp.]
MEQSPEHYLALAVEAARAGGDVVRAGALNRANLSIERKRPNDFVSEIDRGSEVAILSHLRAHLPGHAVQAEESGTSGDSDYVWLIDPLDGTTNFLHGFPHYCISVAMQFKGKVVVGVVYDPIHQRLFTATQGGGAWLNGQRLSVTGPTSLAECLLGTGLPFSEWTYLDGYLSSLRTIMQRCGGVRRAGAAALDLAFVAAGWLDGFWEKDLNPWDVGAGSLLVEEAGGVVSDFSGGGGFIERRQIVAGARAVQAELVSVLHNHADMCA